jgi:hypothetical protein
MKKSLLAVAALGAFASAAQAQSSVTVYGILDMGYVGANSRQASSTVTKTTSSAIASNVESTSRIGFKGTEDLGGGLSAFFTIEQKLDPDAASAIDTGATGNRQTFVGLKKAGLGAIALGSQYTVIHDAASVTDAAGENNLAGNLIYSNGVGAATLSKLTVTSSGDYAGQSYVIRQANALTLKSDNFSGFTARGMLVQKNANATQTGSAAGGTSNASGWGLGLDYQWNKLYLTVNAQSFTARNTSSNTGNAAPTMVLFGTGQANTAGTNVQDNGQYYAATYDFGMLKAFAQYVARNSKADSNTAYYQKYNATQIGVSSFVTPTIRVFAAGGYGKFTPFGLSSPQANINGFQVGSDYFLSKRTNLYAIYGQTGTSNIAPVAGGAYQSFNQNNYSVGVRHTF